MDWQPIETAPKDGTRVDLWCGRRLANCYWSFCESPNDDDAKWRQEYSEVPGGIGFEIDGMPTHWMPRPAPPKEIEE